MAYFGGSFDASQVEPKGDYRPLPPGEYKVQITSSEFCQTSTGNGHQLKLEMEILEGDQAGRRLYDRLNLDNPNAQAVEIAQRTLSAICHAVGKLSVQDSEELHMLPMIAVVIVKPERTGKDGRTYSTSNEVQTYKALGSGQAASFGGGGTKPANAAPAAGSGQSASAPWKRSAA
ncbi:MAG: DUF669 domain-containing protein [Sphingomonadaceae bacterium]|nr:DUF669 domain-containing protein [Sphingomonadaceae bacterium]